MPQCDECGKSISIWNILLPWRTNYKLSIVNSEWKEEENVTVCYECFQFYKNCMKVVTKLGLDRLEALMEGE